MSKVVTTLKSERISVRTTEDIRKTIENIVLPAFSVEHECKGNMTNYINYLITQDLEKRNIVF